MQTTSPNNLLSPTYDLYDAQPTQLPTPHISWLCHSQTVRPWTQIWYVENDLKCINSPENFRCRSSARHFLMIQNATFCTALQFCKPKTPWNSRDSRVLGSQAKPCRTFRQQTACQWTKGMRWFMTTPINFHHSANQFGTQKETSLYTMYSSICTYTKTNNNSFLAKIHLIVSGAQILSHPLT